MYQLSPLVDVKADAGFCQSYLISLETIKYVILVNVYAVVTVLD